MNRKKKKWIVIGACVAALLFLIALVIALCPVCKKSKVTDGGELTRETTMDNTASSLVATEDAVSYGEISNDAYADEAASYDAGYEEDTLDLGMVHYSGRLTLETLDFEQALQEVDAFVQEFGAAVISSYQSDSDVSWYMDDFQPRSRQRTATYEFRIASDRFQDACEGIGNFSGKVVSRSIESEDMTRDYNNNNDRLDALRAERDQLMALAEEADTADALVVIYDHIADINTEISSLETNQNDITYDADYATLYLTIEEVLDYTETPDDGEPFLTRIRNAFTGGWGLFVTGVESLVLIAVGMWPVVVLLAAVILVIFFTAKKSRKPSAETKGFEAEDPGCGKEASEGGSGLGKIEEKAEADGEIPETKGGKDGGEAGA